MKPASIISLVIAVLLVIIGLVGCIIAQNMAHANGEYLFAENREGNYVKTVDLTDSEISKIELIAEDAEINIYGRQEKSYIEFVNFKENYYSLSTANRVLSFDEIPDLKSMLKFWENGFSFKGMRYIFNFNNQANEDQPKIINIYLTNEKDIKIFDIKINSLKLNISNMTSGTDYNIMSKEALINANVIRTSSVFNINEGSSAADYVDINFDTALIQYVNINAQKLNLKSAKFRCSGVADIVCESGMIDLFTINKPADLKLALITDGKILVDGSEVMSPYSQIGSENTQSEIKINSERADIKISSSAANPDTQSAN